jgi:hypothetical protein
MSQRNLLLGPLRQFLSDRNLAKVSAGLAWRRPPTERWQDKRRENGIADVSDPMFKDRVNELRAIRDQARADAERGEEAVERLGPSVTPQALKTFARQARRRMRTESGGYRRDHFRALGQRVEVDAKEIRIMGSKSVLLRTLVAAASAKTAGFGVPSFVCRSGAPRSMKMGTIAALWPYDAVAHHALQSVNLRWPAILHYASWAA